MGDNHLHIKTNVLSKEDKKKLRQDFFKEVEQTFFPIWLSRSRVAYTMDEKKRELWRELLYELYHGKMLNKAEMFKQMDFQRRFLNEDLHRNTERDI